MDWSLGWYSFSFPFFGQQAQQHYSNDHRFQALDASRALWLTTLNDPAQRNLKDPAAEVMQLKEEGRVDAIKGVFSDALFQCYVIKMRSQVESYQNELYTRHQVLAAKPVDVVSDSRYLLTAIADLTL